MSAAKNSEVTEEDYVRIRDIVFPESHQGEDYSVLEPYILQEHAENTEDLEYRAVEEDGCPKVVVSRDEDYLEKGELSEGSIVYSSKLTPDGVTIIEMYVNTKSRPGKAAGSKPWNDIIESLKEKSREREQNMIETRKLLRG